MLFFSVPVVTTAQRVVAQSASAQDCTTVAHGGIGENCVATDEGLTKGRASGLAAAGLAHRPAGSPPSLAQSWAPIENGDRLAREPSRYDVHRIGQRGIGENNNQRSLEKSLQLGTLMARDIDAQHELVTDPEITEYVNRLGKNIVRHSDAPTSVITIKVIESGEIGAFALPGGYLYVTSGIMKASDSEAEFAGILAHEIAHVAAGHDAKLQRHRRAWNIAVHCSGPVGFAVQFAGLLFSMKDVRNAEREADLLGIEYAYAAGYDPEAFVDFLRRMRLQEKKKHNQIAGAFATHPTARERVKLAETEISRLLPVKAQYIVDTSEFEQEKARLAGFTEDSRHSLAPVPLRSGSSAD
jgi:predicted Zn-dependent protease